MASTMIPGGHDLATPLPKSDSKKVTKDSRGYHVTYTSSASPDLDLSGYTIGSDDETYGVPLQRVELIQKSPQTADLSTTYEHSGNVHNGGEPEKELRMGVEQVHLKTLQAAGVTLTKDESDELKKSPDTKRTRAMPILLYTYTTYNATFSWSEDGIAAGLAEPEAPTGISSATAAKWRYTGPSIRCRGGVTTIPE